MTISRNPGWHRLPNGVAVYSNTVADKFLDPVEGSMRNNFVKENYMEEGDTAFRYLGPSWDPDIDILGTITFRGLL